MVVEGLRVQIEGFLHRFTAGHIVGGRTIPTNGGTCPRPVVTYSHAHTEAMNALPDR